MEAVRTGVASLLIVYFALRGLYITLNLTPYRSADQASISFNSDCSFPVAAARWQRDWEFFEMKKGNDRTMAEKEMSIDRPAIMQRQLQRSEWQKT